MIFPKIIATPYAVAKHYNDLDAFYRMVWGEHLHHGFWENGKESASEATERLIDLVANKAAIQKNVNICDIGCGYGAIAKILSQKLGARVVGITISKAQFDYAQTSLVKDQNLQFLLGDFLENPLNDHSFDVALSIESSEQMIDKQRFFKEAFRILKPGGRLVICSLLSTDSPRNWEKKFLLEPICEESQLPSMGSVKDYSYFLSKAGFKEIEYLDLTKFVKKTGTSTLKRGLKSLLISKTFRELVLSSENTFAYSLLRIRIAYALKSMQYGMFTARK